MTLSREEVESLMAQVHQSNLPTAVARRLEEIARTCLWLVFALQESLLVKAPCPKFHVLGVRFIRGMFRTFASFDCRLQGRFSERF